MKRHRPPARLRRPFVLSIVLGAVLLVVPACSGIVDEAPPVQDSLFVEALVDLHLVEARAEAGLPPLDAPRAALLERHGLDRAAYEAAVAYYSERPQAYYELYSRVLSRIHEEAQEAPTPPTGP